jgi:hypothetical protein
MNGVFSVIGSVSVIIISMMSTFTFAFVIGAVAYGVAATLVGAVWLKSQTQP